MKRHNAHIESLTLVAERLSQLETEIVFTGGAVVGLLLTDAVAPDVRPTKDIDAVVAITRYSEYALLQDQLRKLGFSHDIDGPNCRFILHGLQVDLMPTEGDVLGFANCWYRFAMISATAYVLPNGQSIKLVSAPAFIATKLEAFRGRGNNDYIMSHDIADILAVIDGRPELVDEINSSPKDVKKYICAYFSQFLSERTFTDAISAHLPPDEASQARQSTILDRMRKVALP